MEKLLEKFNMKPNPSELEAARAFLEKDYAMAIERLETSPLKKELPIDWPHIIINDEKVYLDT